MRKFTKNKKWEHTYGQLGVEGGIFKCRLKPFKGSAQTFKLDHIFPYTLEHIIIYDKTGTVLNLVPPATV